MLRLLIYGRPGTPIFEVGESLSNFYNVSMYGIQIPLKEYDDYFSDKIDEHTLDTGDYSSGSASSRGHRDPYSMEKDKDLKYKMPPVDIRGLCLNDEEKGIVKGISQGIIVTEIPDSYLIEWANDIVFLTVKENSAIEWFGKRLFCPSCGNVHHMEEKPCREPGVCDRCGTDLVKREIDSPKSVKKCFMNWDTAFWRFSKEARVKRHKIFNIDKFDNFRQLVSHVERLVQNKVFKNDWYEIFRREEGDGPSL